MRKILCRSLLAISLVSFLMMIQSCGDSNDGKPSVAPTTSPLATPTSTFALDPNKKPGQNFDLASFKLQTLNSSNAFTEISQPTLATYSDAYFFTSSTTGAMVFWCPVTGGTSSGTSYPRSELKNNADFKLNGNYTQTGSLKVTVVPSNGELIFAQIHGYSTGSEALKLRWSNGSIKVGTKTAIGDSEAYSTLASGLSLGDLITYSININNYKLTINVNGSPFTLTYSSSSWSAENCYFKAGSYVQDNSGTSSEGGQVEYYALVSNN